MIRLGPALKRYRLALDLGGPTVARAALGPDAPKKKIKSFANYLSRVEGGKVPNLGYQWLESLAKGFGFTEVSDFLRAVESGVSKGDSAIFIEDAVLTRVAELDKDLPLGKSAISGSTNDSSEIHGAALDPEAIKQFGLAIANAGLTLAKAVLPVESGGRPATGSPAGKVHGHKTTKPRRR